MNFTGKNILIIGGSSGIGLRLTEKLSEAGATIIAASRSEAKSFEDLGVQYLELDVTSNEVSALEDSLPDELHGIVYCPGTINLKPFQSLTPDDFRTDYEINLLGAVGVVKAALKPLRKSKGASVVMFSTVATKAGMAYHASIAAAKAAVEGFIVSMACEYARAQIRFNAVAPSLTDTPLAEQLLGSDKKRDAAAQRHPLKRHGTPDDIAAAAMYLLSDDASWVTGQVLRVDGGLSSLRPL